MLELFKALKNKMPTPTWFGWYHLMWLGILIVACVLIYIFRQKISKKAVNITVLVCGIVLVLLELLKQIERSYSIDDAGSLSWHYPPSDFPFQFCSTAMYIMLLAGIILKGKVYDALMSYIGVYALFAGALVMIYPLGVFVESIFINVHTMIWHSSMFIVGFLVLATRSIEFKIKSVLKATIVFVGLLAMAILMNVVAHIIAPDEYFNMYYIGPYYPNNFVVLQDIYKHVPWGVFLFIYILGFFFATLLIMLIAIGADKLERVIQYRKQTKKVN